MLHTLSHFDSDGDNTAQAVYAGGGSIHYLHIINTNASDAYLQLFDVAAGSVTVGTTTPMQSYLVPGNGAFERSFGEVGIKFERAITYACTTTATGSGDPSTGLTVNALYRKG